LLSHTPFQSHNQSLSQFHVPDQLPSQPQSLSQLLQLSLLLQLALQLALPQLLASVLVSVLDAADSKSLQQLSNWLAHPSIFDLLNKNFELKT